MGLSRGWNVIRVRESCQSKGAQFDAAIVFVKLSTNGPARLGRNTSPTCRLLIVFSQTPRSLRLARNFVGRRSEPPKPSAFGFVQGRHPRLQSNDTQLACALLTYARARAHLPSTVSLPTHQDRDASLKGEGTPLAPPDHAILPPGWRASSCFSQPPPRS